MPNQQLTASAASSTSTVSAFTGAGFTAVSDATAATASASAPAAHGLRASARHKLGFLARRLRRAFTVMELLIVLGVLGIVAAAAGLVYSNATDAAKEKALNANVDTINRLLRQYSTAGGKFATTYVVGTTTVDGTLPTAAAALLTALQGGVYVSGVQMKVTGKFTAASYTTVLESGGGYIVQKAANAKQP
jgi:prepilin-type N-terminal cleavage/methylation domain-containing protein